ncbi:hypothetical protein GCM10010275_71030 [Streptomyces litmocidini]|uniref:hypothetical protein n=1 Tax=Streptomyces litmocidini TaxID=67318 RepID=UPI00167D8E54|nr:hypothetical protein [Streptomyces litmocidini]GGV19170.1 hypothetical protein GCM10010275_71030 [Streptomyces litmocidini]
MRISRIELLSPAVLGAAALTTLPAATAVSAAADRPCAASTRWEGDRKCYTATAQGVALVDLHIQTMRGRDHARAEGMVEEGGAVWMEVKKNGGPAKRVYLKRVPKGGPENPYAESRQKSTGWQYDGPGYLVRGCAANAGDRLKACTGWH